MKFLAARERPHELRYEAVRGQGSELGKSETACFVLRLDGSTSGRSTWLGDSLEPERPPPATASFSALSCTGTARHRSDRPGWPPPAALRFVPSLGHNHLFHGRVQAHGDLSSPRDKRMAWSFDSPGKHEAFFT